MRIAIALTTLALIATPVLAQTALSPKRGATLRDVNATRLGTIDRINGDGSVQIIFNSKFVTIPANKLVVAQDAVSTSLTKSEVSKLR
ncbi:MAG: hypothetical protein JWO15_2000 [Sphingomonadales bacterium]|nr:hypothetical protein [Sphingomonadales bacterium]